MRHSHQGVLPFALLAFSCASSGPAAGEDATSPAVARSGMRIAVTSVFVDNPAKAHAFYTDVLGFRSKEFNPSTLVAIVVSADDPDGTALLLEPIGAPFAREYQEKVYNAGLPIIIFGVDDVPATIERLESKGVRFRHDLAKKVWGLENMFEDTFGNLIMLQANDQAAGSR